MNLDGKKFLVTGSGLSGIAAAELLVNHHLPVVLYDGKEDMEPEEIRQKSPLLEKVEIYTGRLPEQVLLDCNTAILSPGVPLDSPDVERMKEAGLSLWGEIELACMFERGRVLAVTGTNGKTTTTVR